MAQPFEKRDIERELRAISACNQTLLRAHDEMVLIRDVCRIVCDEAGYRMAWVGYARDDDAKTVEPVASAGYDHGYVAGIRATWADTERGRGPTGRAVRDGEASYVQDIATDPGFAPWRDAALDRGYRSGICLPLKPENGRPFGSFTVYGSEPNAFTPEEYELLSALAADLSYGIQALRTRAEREAATTALAESEHELEASESRFETLFMLAPMAVTLSRRDDGLLLDVNDAFSEMVGWSREAAVGRTIPELGIWTDIDERRGFLEELDRAGAASRTITVRHRDGSHIVGELSGRLVTLDGADCVLAVVRDVTEQREREERIFEGRERLRAIIDNAPVGIAQLDLEGRFVDVNDRLAEILGRTRDELIGVPTSSFAHPDEAAMHAPLLAEIITEGALGRHVHGRNITKTGETVWVDVSITLAKDSGGNPAYFLAVYQDVTERRAAEHALQRSTRALRTLTRVNETIVRAVSEADLLTRVCETIVEQQQYALTWVGIVQDDEARTVKPVAQAGPDAELLRDLRVSAGEGPDGQGAIGRCIRAKAPVAIQGMSRAYRGTPWDGMSQHWGLECVVSLPLIDGHGEAFGALVMYSHDPQAFGDDEVSLLANLADDVSFSIEALRSRDQRIRAEADLVVTNERLEELLVRITETMGRIVEVRDPYTQGHQKGVASIAVQIAEEMGLSDEERRTVEVAATVHDLGKLAVPVEILTKPGKLSELEYSLIQAHSQTGFDILEGIDFGFPVATAVLQHHEYLDGSGYPKGLSGDEVCVPARILAVADTLQAMATDRPYRAALGIEAAMAQILSGGGKYDPAVVDACVRLYESGRLTL